MRYIEGLAEAASTPKIAKVVTLTPQSIHRLGHPYQQTDLEGALYEKQRPGAAEEAAWAGAVLHTRDPTDAIIAIRVGSISGR